MILILKIASMLCCSAIGYQDLTKRTVYWFFFPMLGLLLGFLHYNNSTTDLFITYTTLNTLLVSLIILILFIYTKLITKKPFINHSFGLGDFLFFYAFAVGFPTPIFIVLFASSILFSAFIFFIFKSKMRIKSVPLAGLMGLYLVVIFCYNIFSNSPSLYFI